MKSNDIIQFELEVRNIIIINIYILDQILYLQFFRVVQHYLLAKQSFFVSS